VHPLVGVALLLVIPGALIGAVLSSGAMDWVEAALVKPGHVPESALIGTVVAAVILPAIAAVAVPLLHRQRYGECWLRDDLLSVEPGGISIPREEIKGWRRTKWGLVLDTTFLPDSALVRPVLIPVEGEQELEQALRWLEQATSPGPPGESKEGEQAGASVAEDGQAGPRPLVQMSRQDSVFTLVVSLGLLAVLVPAVGFIRFGFAAGPAPFILGAALSMLASGIVGLCITRHSVRVLATRRALLVGRRRIPYEEVEDLVVGQRTVAFVHRREGKATRRWSLLQEGQAEALRATLQERLSPEESAGLQGELPAWAREEPRRVLARVLTLGLVVFGLGILSLPGWIYGQVLAPFGVFKEIRVYDNDGHVMTLLYTEGEPRPRFLYLASEGASGGTRGYQIQMPGLLGSENYGLNLGSGSREVNVAEGRIVDTPYRCPLPKTSTGVLRFGASDWAMTSEPLPADLGRLGLAMDEEAGESKRFVESIPASLEPLLADPTCPPLIRDFVEGRTSWRVQEASDVSGQQVVAVVLQGRVRTLALLPRGEPCEVNFSVIGRQAAGQSISFRSLTRTPATKTTANLVLSKQEDSKLCWPGSTGWNTVPIGTIDLDALLKALAQVRAHKVGAAEALSGLLGSAWPQELERE